MLVTFIVFRFFFLSIFLSVASCFPFPLSCLSFSGLYYFLFSFHPSSFYHITHCFIILFHNQILNYMIAGRDTTACMLTWAMYRLAKHPDVQKRLLDEVDSFKGELGYAALSHFTLLEAFIHEVLRLHPSVPMDSKRAIKDDQFPDGTFIPAGVVVRYNPYVVNRLDAFWKDGEEFLIDRWLKDEKPTNFQYPTFNAGPRTCLGRFLALMEGKL